MLTDSSAKSITASTAFSLAPLIALDMPSSLSPKPHVLCAEVILPLPLRNTFTYLIPETWTAQAERGMRVRVPLGKNKRYYGLITQIYPPNVGQNLSQLKEIEALPDAEPIASPWEIDQWTWAAEYYITSLYAFMKTAIPSIYFPQSEMVVTWQEKEALLENLSPMVYNIRGELVLAPKRSLKITTLEQRLGKEIYHEVEKLLKKGILTSHESLPLSKRSIGVAYLSLEPVWWRRAQQDPSLLPSERSTAQRQLIFDLLDRLDRHPQGTEGDVLEEELIGHKPSRQTALRNLIRKGILRRQFRLPRPARPQGLPPESPSTFHVLNTPRESGRVEVALLASCPREIEFVAHYIAPAMASGDQNILVLVPYTHAFSPMVLLLEAFKDRGWGNACITYTADTTPQERIQTRQRLLRGDKGVCLVGSRNAALLPTNVWDKIVILHEEDANYKNGLSEPYFSAIDYLVATKAKHTTLCMTTTTPRAELRHLIDEGKYQLIYEEQPTHRFAPIELVDLKKERRQKSLAPDALLSRPLRKAITQTIEAGNNMLLIAHRKGYAPTLLCTECAKPIVCPHCDVHLVFHKAQQRLSCHYCGYTTRTTHYCPHCQGELKYQGFGIERIAEEVEALVPDAQVVAVDGSSLGGYTPASKAWIASYSSTKPTVWIATKIIASVVGLSRLSQIGVLNLNEWVSIPDFRATERAWSTFTLLGDAYPEASWIIQSYDTEHPLLERLRQPSRWASAIREIEERQLLSFPPSVRMAYIHIYTPTEAESQRFGELLTMRLSAYTDLFCSVMGPIVPQVSWVNLQYIRYICLRFIRQAPWRAIRQAIAQETDRLRQETPRARTYRIVYDIDPS